MPSVPINLTTLPAHSIFTSSSDGKKQEEWELVDKPTDDLVGIKSNRMIMRDKELIVASGSEIRVCSLSGDSLTVDGDAVGAYKTLRAECLNFHVESLVLNPTERLLAVVGRKQVAVLALPTLRLGDDTTGKIDCRYVCFVRRGNC
jgi:nucleoporin NUP82